MSLSVLYVVVMMYEGNVRKVLIIVGEEDGGQVPIVLPPVGVFFGEFESARLEVSAARRPNAVVLPGSMMISLSKFYVLKIQIILPHDVHRFEEAIGVPLLVAIQQDGEHT
jgi:hypothetical protein